jgi:hypothetical protein
MTIRDHRVGSEFVNTREAGEFLAAEGALGAEKIACSANPD